jgi:glutaredoxin-related protein
MNSQSELDRLCAQARVVVFHSPVTDLGGLDDTLTNAGVEWTRVELGMGNAANRELFHDLQAITGHRTLPQLFVDGAFVGGIEALPQCLGEDAAAPRAATWMGYLGLLPFIAGMVGMWSGVAGAGTWLAAYGAVILSFVGAIHWGAAASRCEYAPLPYALSVVPALIGWIALLLPPGPGLALLALAFTAWRITEYGLLEAHQPGWLRLLRTRLTFGATVILLVGAAVTLL